MTKELLPGLGSGALREALTRIRHTAARDQVMNDPSNLLEEVYRLSVAALSLSSPIEPNGTELRDMLEAACVMAEMDEVPAKVTVLWWRAALRGEKPPK